MSGEFRHQFAVNLALFGTVPLIVLGATLVFVFGDVLNEVKVRIFGDEEDEVLTRVVRVIDGDTIAVEPTDDLPATDDDGDERHVRLLGVDAPEMNYSGDEDPECGAQAATDQLEELLPAGAGVTITYDERADREDRYGRTLAYVDGWDDVGLVMAREGYAAAWYPDSAPEPSRYSEYADAADSARDAGAGAWAECEAMGR